MTDQHTPETNHADDPLWRIVGGTVLAFGANDKGELFLSIRKGELVSDFIIGQEAGELTLYEALPAPSEDAPGDTA